MTPLLDLSLFCGKHTDTGFRNLIKSLEQGKQRLLQVRQILGQ